MIFKISKKKQETHSISIVEAPEVESLSALQKTHLENKKYYIEFDDSIKFYIASQFNEKDEFESENFRNLGSTLYKVQSEYLSSENVNISINEFKEDKIFYALIEGFSLSAYKFSLKSKSEKEKTFHFDLPDSKREKSQEILNLAESVFVARDLVNMPYSHLGAAELAKEVEKLGEKAKFETEIFGLKKIQSLKMGGILAVNKGSTSEPRFCILKYMNGGNAKPLVLVGKGVVYDTGGLSLKPTAGSMDKMKSDMGGAAVVAATIYSIAKNKLPVNVIGLIPATDNMPGPDAITPGDVITMYDKSTVEVLNTDAEGRLILADALSYSSKFNPALVIDLATLTGSAYRAFGTNAMAMMGTAGEYQGTFESIGNELFERVISLPLWNDYGDQLKSDIADLKNIGGPTAGMITAGKFLEHFVKHPWLHFDIAGVTFLDKASSYRGKNASGTGVRLMYHFIKNQLEEWKNQ